jgi:glycosyltransferase involved in cell wall biosynthesis
MPEVTKTDNMPLVSVCIPVYNNADYVSETMMSVLHQTYSNIELIIVDDDSKDDSLSVIQKTGKEAQKAGLIDNVIDLTEAKIVYYNNTSSDPVHTVPEIDFQASHIPEVVNNQRQLYIYHNDKNLGMSGNWNRCMELCRGKFIKLICADDQIASSLIQREVEVMKKYPQVDLVESDTEFRNNDNKPSGQYKRYGKGLVDGRVIAKHSLFMRDYFGAPLANLIRSSAYKKMGGFDPMFSYIIDYDFFMKIACQGKVYVIREPLNYFRIRSDSNTGEVLGGDKGNIYVEEHQKLAQKYAVVLGLSARQVTMSVQMRKLMNFLGGLYLKMKLTK